MLKATHEEHAIKHHEEEQEQGFLSPVLSDVKPHAQNSQNPKPLKP